MALRIAPITLHDANAYVVAYHRHHGKARGHRFSLSVVDGDALVGVAIVGRPVSRVLDDGVTAEVLRVCTNGTPNACSMLYGACRRAVREMGYARIYTYTLQSEPGTSLRAAGWREDIHEPSGTVSWDTRAGRAEPDRDKKRRWVCVFASARGDDHASGD